MMLQPCYDPQSCPLKVLSSFLEFKGREPVLWFRHFTRHQFWAVTSRALQEIGLTGLEFGTHSLRIGAASMAAAIGYASDWIHALGRWRSSADLMSGHYQSSKFVLLTLVSFSFSAMGSRTGVYMKPQFCLLSGALSQKIGVWHPARP